jgi:NAD+-dependent protein deacetylase SIR2
VGAGISTSAGIPDFRSPDTGLYANLARLNLPYPEAVFDISFFRQNPDPFYALAHELYPGKFRPTITHSFIRLLHEKGLLLKCFTQNIDCLEREAGVLDEDIVEAHGSFATQRCIDCKKEFPRSLMVQKIEEKAVPRCLNVQCNGLVKPDIVFFGESLPESFFRNRALPARADLAIIMGTSLSVAPFSSLPEYCEEGTPRLLINMDRVGSLGCRTDDVLLLGDCDSGVRTLAKELGWLEELEALWAKTAPEKSADPAADSEGHGKGPEATREKTKDEAVEDQVRQLAEQIEQTLKTSEAHKDGLMKHLEKHMDKKADKISEKAEKAGSITPAPAQPEDHSTAEVEAKNAPEDEPKTAKTNQTDSPDGEAHQDNDAKHNTLKSNTDKADEGGIQHVLPHLEEKPSL